MPDLGAGDYQLARFAIERGLGAIYLIAFVVAWRQFPALNGEHGLEPAPRLLAARSFWHAPSLFHFGYSDRRLRIAAIVGAALAALVVLGVPQRAPLPVTIASWLVLWALYQSIVNIGGTFYGFGWESLLLEAGFLAIFLGNQPTAPAWPVILAYRWLGFRLEFGAGMIKLRGDPCWRQLTCMQWHHETQPMPNPLSWYFHHLPAPLHRVEVIGNFVAQLVLPFGLFCPQPIAALAAGSMIVTQLYLIVSGNYAWLNWITVTILFAGIADPTLGSWAGWARAPVTALPGWFATVVIAVALLIAVLSWWPARNLLSRHQMMNASFDPFHLVNTYGAFGSVGRRRYEVIVEGTADESPGRQSEWREYEFIGKPGDVHRRPSQIAPYHLRLDWLMWFLPLAPHYGESWFVPFLVRLLEGDPAILRLLARNPFPHRPPAAVRAVLYAYRYTTPAERRESGAWWVRTYAGVYADALRLVRQGGRSYAVPVTAPRLRAVRDA
jgi:hypothetical protein